MQISQSKITSKDNFTHFNIIFSSPFSLTFPTFAMPKLVHAHENVLAWKLIKLINFQSSM